MNLQNFEQKLKSIMDAYSPELETADIWQHIEPELPPQQEPRRRIWLFFMTVGVMAVAIALSLGLREADSSSATAALHHEVAAISTTQSDAEDNSVPASPEVQTAQPLQNATTQAGTQSEVKTLVPTSSEKKLSPSAKPQVQNGHPISGVSQTHHRHEETDGGHPALKTREEGTISSMIQIDALPHRMLERPRRALPRASSLTEPLADSHSSSFSLAEMRVTSGLGTALDHYQDKGDQEGLLASRMSSESPLENWSLGLQSTWRLADKWSVGVGALYLHQQSQSIVNSVTEVTETVDNLTGQIRRTTSRYSRQVRRRALLLPVTLHHYLLGGRNWNVEMQGGLVYNAWQKTSGHEQDQNDLSYDLSQDEDARLRKASHRVLLGSHYSKQLKEGLQMNLGLLYLPEISGLYDSELLIQKKQSSLQMTAGISISI